MPETAFLPGILLELAAYACAATFTPGPNNILLLGCTGKFGLQRCLPLLFGIWTGLLSVMLVCGFGCAWLGELVPQVVPCAKYIGAAYVLYLAYRTLLHKTGSAGNEQPTPPTYVNGFLLQFLNVKILSLGVAAYSGYILPHGFRVSMILGFTAVMAGCAAAGNLIWATAGVVLFPLYQRFDTAVNAVMALLLVWCAWKIALM